MHRPIHSSMSSVADHGGGDNTGAEGAGEPPGGEEEVDEELEEKMRRYPEDFQVERPARRVFGYDWSQGYVSPFRETEAAVVDAVLDALSGDLCSSSVVYDLGCGNGVFLLRAALRYGCQGVGYDLDEALLAEARAAAEAQGTSHLLTFKAQDLFTVELDGCTAVYMYLLPPVLQKLQPALEQRRRKGGGVVLVANTWAVDGLGGGKREGVVTGPGKQGVFYVYR